MNARPTLAYSRPDLVAETNHRVANSLSMLGSLIRMQASSIGSKPLIQHEMGTILEELGHRVEIVAGLHRLLAQRPSDPCVNLGGYLRQICDAIVSALTAAEKVRLRFACSPDCHVAPEEALSLGLIVAELVMNAAKYAHPAGVAGDIDVTCHADDDGTITVAVSDDGVGLPEAFDPLTDGNLGLQFVRLLAAELPARISFAHNALGTSFALQMAGNVRRGDA